MRKRARLNRTSTSMTPFRAPASTAWRCSTRGGLLGRLLTTVLLPGAGPAVPAPAAADATLLRRYTVWVVVITLFTIQYRVRPAGTFKLNQPIMKGRNFRMAFAWAWLGSALCCGDMIFWEANWEMMRRTGRTR